MRRLVCAWLVGLLCAGGTPALAKDVCFSLPGVSGFVVFGLKQFVTPGRNRCKPVSGFSTVPGWMLDGSACTSLDGTSLRLSLAAAPVTAGPATFQVGCSVPLPALTGGTCRGTYVLSGGSQEVFGFTTSADFTSCVANVP